MKGIHVIYVVLPILVLIAWQQVRAASVREQLVQVRNELASKKQRLVQVRTQETATVQKIRQNATGMQQQSKKIHEAEKTIHKLDVGIVQKQTQAKEAGLIKGQREHLREARVVEMYKMFVIRDELAVFGMPSATSSLATTCFASAIEQDSKLITEHIARISSLERQKAELQTGIKQQEAFRATGKREYAMLGKDTHQQKAVLASVQKEQERIKAEIQEYEAKQQRLKSLLARLSKAPKKQVKQPATVGRGNEARQPERPAPAMPADFEKFRLPVGGGKVVRGYGVYRHPDWGTSTFSSGLTIEAEAGTPIRSIASGTVVYSGNLKGYGNIIIIDHGQQVFSVYAHCGSMMKRVGAQIARGETIASVGSTDDDTPSVYFELRSKGKAVNPSKWLIG